MLNMLVFCFYRNVVTVCDHCFCQFIDIIKSGLQVFSCAFKFLDSIFFEASLQEESGIKNSPR